MQLDGMIRTNCPPDAVALLLGDAGVLAKVAPQGCSFGEKAGDTIPFTLQRKIGVISLNLAGKIALTKTPDSDTYQLYIEASHRIGGGVKITLDLVPQTDADGQTSLTWNGMLRSHGLTSRIVKEQSTQAETIVKNLFQRLRAQAEAAPDAA